MLADPNGAVRFQSSRVCACTLSACAQGTISPVSNGSMEFAAQLEKLPQIFPRLPVSVPGGAPASEGSSTSGTTPRTFCDSPHDRVSICCRDRRLCFASIVFVWTPLIGWLPLSRRHRLFSAHGPMVRPLNLRLHARLDHHHAPCPTHAPSQRCGRALE